MNKMTKDIITLIIVVVALVITVLTENTVVKIIGVAGAIAGFVYLVARFKSKSSEGGPR